MNVITPTTARLNRNLRVALCVAAVLVVGFLPAGAIVNLLGAGLPARILTAAGFGVGLVLVLAYVWFGNAALEARTTRTRTARAQLVEDTYGIFLSTRQLLELLFPDERPAHEPLIFGRTRIVRGDLSEQVIRLAWQGGRLLLIDTDGVELPRVGRRA
jgi:hypothetical protein